MRCALWLLSACTTRDPGQQPGPPACTDEDEDGACADLDCDDLDASSHPGAAETWYSGVDEACDGGDDFDADGDGAAIGELVVTWRDYTYPDCDDTNPAVFPGAAPICGNNIDDDCDERDDCSRRGTLVTTDATVARLVNGYPLDAADLDGDGTKEWISEDYGGPFRIIPSFTTGTVIFATDDYAPFPHSADWAFGSLGGVDGVDVAVEGFWNSVAIYRDPELDPLPDASILTVSNIGAIEVGDVTGDGSDDIIIGNYLASAGASLIYAGPFDGERTEADWAVEIAPARDGDRVGEYLAGAGDLTGDGLPDLAATDHVDDFDRWVPIFPAPVVGSLTPDAGWSLGSALDTAEIEVLLDSSIDWNQDGYLDLMLDDAGLPQIYFGPFDGDRGLAGWDARVGGVWEYGDTTPWPAWPEPCGDLNGDTFQDLCTSDLLWGNVGTTVLYGPFVGQHADWLDDDLTIVSAEGRIADVLPIGDIDRDGADDLLITTDLETEDPEVYNDVILGLVGFGF